MAAVIENCGCKKQLPMIVFCMGLKCTHNALCLECYGGHQRNRQNEPHTLHMKCVRCLFLCPVLHFCEFCPENGCVCLTCSVDLHNAFAISHIFSPSLMNEVRPDDVIKQLIILNSYLSKPVVTPPLFDHQLFITPTQPTAFSEYPHFNQVNDPLIHGFGAHLAVTNAQLSNVIEAISPAFSTSSTKGRCNK